MRVRLPGHPDLPRTEVAGEILPRMNRTRTNILAVVFVMGVSVVAAKLWPSDSWPAIIGVALVTGAAAFVALWMRDRISN